MPYTFAPLEKKRDWAKCDVARVFAKAAGMVAPAMVGTGHGTDALDTCCGQVNEAAAPCITGATGLFA